MNHLRGIGITPGAGTGYEFITRELPEAYGTAVRVKVLAVGQCSTDKAVISGGWGGAPHPGQLNIITGHEIVVVVSEILGDTMPDYVKVGGIYHVVVREPMQYPDPTNGEYGIPASDMWPADMSGSPTKGHHRPQRRRWFEHGIIGMDGGLISEMVVDFRALVPVKAGTPLLAAPLAEPVSCLRKLYRMGKADHDAKLTAMKKTWAEDFDPTLDRAIVLGITGQSGWQAAAMLKREGLDVVGIGRRSEDDPTVQRLSGLGITYRRYDDSDPVQYINRMWMDPQVGAGGEDRDHCGVRYVLNACGNPVWMQNHMLLLGGTGVGLEFSIPGEPFMDGKHDQAEPLKNMTVENIGTVGTVNANTVLDWPVACDDVLWWCQRDPTNVHNHLLVVDGIGNLAALTAATNDKFQKAVVCPNGIKAVEQAAAAAGYPVYVST